MVLHKHSVVISLHTAMFCRGYEVYDYWELMEQVFCILADFSLNQVKHCFDSLQVIVFLTH